LNMVVSWDYVSLISRSELG